MFDSHCHLDFAEFDTDRDRLVDQVRDGKVRDGRVQDGRVRAIHVPGVGPEQWARAAALTSTEGIGCGVGIHPQWLERLSSTELADALDALRAQARAQGAEAIGEVGLDGNVAKRAERASLDTQAAVLDVHLEVARSLELPIVLHVFQAQGRALEILQRHGPLPAGGVMHSYSGPAEMVESYARLGLFFSFAAPVTRDEARRPREAARAVPDGRLLVESDGPYQKLTGHRRGGPDDLPTICAAVAEARGTTAQAIAELTHDNAVRLFQR
jgi:TatD DNase family protein